MSSTLSSQERFLLTAAHLQARRRVLFLTTSNRWSQEKNGEIAKSTQLAHLLRAQLPTDVEREWIDIPTLHIAPCEGNVSTAHGNVCGVQEAMLKNKEQNPTGHHRCWASLNDSNDELWKVSRAIFAADTVLFFGSIRWGQMNSIYQKLIERLTWMENRHSTLGESNLLAQKQAGIIVTGQNWNGANVIDLQKQVLEFYGFQVVPELCWNWQYSDDADEEGNQTYLDAVDAFERTFSVFTHS